MAISKKCYGKPESAGEHDCEECHAYLREACGLKVENARMKAENAALRAELDAALGQGEAAVNGRV